MGCLIPIALCRSGKQALNRLEDTCCSRLAPDQWSKVKSPPRQCRPF
nr:RE54930p [Drosophila melanogaster]